MADDFQRLLAGYRRAHRLLDILGIAYFQSVHAFRLAFPARPIEMAVFVAATRTILLKPWLRGTRVSFHERHADVRRRAGLPAREPTSSALPGSLPSHWHPPAPASPLHLEPFRNNLTP